MLKEASNFRHKLWENHDLTVQQVITNIYLCERAMVWNLFILLVKPSSCNGPETELKCKIGFRIYINNIFILSYTDSWCLVPFCMNISGDSPHRRCLCFDFRSTQIYGSLNDRVLCRGWVGGRAGFTARKLLHNVRCHK